MVSVIAIPTLVEEYYTLSIDYKNRSSINISHILAIAIPTLLFMGIWVIGSPILQWLIYEISNRSPIYWTFGARSRDEVSFGPWAGHLALENEDCGGP